MTPYKILTTIAYKLNKVIDKRRQQYYLHVCKGIRNNFINTKIEDYEVTQLIEYLCDFINKNNYPKTINYALNVMSCISRTYIAYKNEYIANNTNVTDWINDEIKKYNL